MSKKKKISKARFLNAKITSTVSITMVLVLLGVTILILFLGKGLSDFVKENMSFNVVLSPNTTETQVATIRKQIDAMPFVKSSRYISKEEAKRQLIEDLGEDPEELLGYNPAQDFIEINLKSEYANNDSLQFIDKKIKQQTNVSDLLYRHEAIDLINNNISKFTTILLILAAVLLFISFTLIRNTIRLSIYSKRFIIHTMKLVGATGGFIRRPFLINNIFTGIFAGLLADAIIWGLLYYFGNEYVELRALLGTTSLVVLFLIVVVLGVVITTAATALSVNRYLKMDTDNLYYA